MRKARPIRYTPLAVSLLLSVTLVMISIYGFHATSRAHVFSRLVWPLIRLMLAISAGLVAGEIIEASGWTRRIAVIAGPLFRFGRLGHRCSVAFTTAFISGVASNAMLQDYYKDGKITRSQLYLTNLANQLPAFFAHLPTTFFMVVPITRWAGTLYFILTFLAAILRMACVLIYGHFRMPSGKRRSGCGIDCDFARRQVIQNHLAEPVEKISRQTGYNGGLCHPDLCRSFLF